MTSLHFLYLHASLNRFARVFYFINKSIYCEEPLETQRSQALFGCTYVFMQCLRCMKGGLLVYKYNQYKFNLSFNRYNACQISCKYLEELYKLQNECILSRNEIQDNSSSITLAIYSLSVCLQELAIYICNFKFGVINFGLKMTEMFVSYLNPRKSVN